MNKVESDMTAMKPMLICTYGQPKTGKTLDALYSFPNGVFIAPPGGLRGAETICGYTPKTLSAETLEQARDHVVTLVKSGDKSFDAIIIDDFSILSEHTVMLAQKKAKNNPFGVWDTNRDLINEIINNTRHSPYHLVLNAHEIGPKEVKNTTQAGGPSLPGRMSEGVTRLCDLVLRTVVDPGRKPFPVVYSCDRNVAEFTTGDRNGIAFDRVPLNIGELLRVAGFNLSRRNDLPWQEDLVKTLSDLRLANKYDGNAALELISQKTKDQKAALWTLRDAKDRAEILQKRVGLSAFVGYV